MNKSKLIAVVVGAVAVTVLGGVVSDQIGAGHSKEPVLKAVAILPRVGDELA